MKWGGEEGEERSPVIPDVFRKVTRRLSRQKGLRLEGSTAEASGGREETTETIKYWEKVELSRNERREVTH